QSVVRGVLESAGVENEFIVEVEEWRLARTLMRQQVVGTLPEGIDEENRALQQVPLVREEINPWQWKVDLLLRRRGRRLHDLDDGPGSLFVGARGSSGRPQHPTRNLCNPADRFRGLSHCDNSPWARG